METHLLEKFYLAIGLNYKRFCLLFPEIAAELAIVEERTVSSEPTIAKIQTISKWANVGSALCAQGHHGMHVGDERGTHSPVKQVTLRAH